ncbi:MAG: protein kinase domain-containing protein, partial [Planctomycetota bacterium]
ASDSGGAGEALSGTHRSSSPGGAGDRPEAGAAAARKDAAADGAGSSGSSRPQRKKVKRGAVGGTDPTVDRETAKLIKNLWRNAVSDATLPGQTIKSLKTAFGRAAPGEAGPSGAVQAFAEAFPTSDLSGYTIGDEIGRGGMGVVYKAVQHSLKRDVAIKLLLPEMAQDPEHAAKFIAEALVNAELSHPNIMPVYEIGQTSDGRKYMVMKLVIGISWWSILHPYTEAEKDVARKFELDDHLDLLLHMCDAVAYAHSRQIIHRDIKPDNLLVGKYGEVLLMDWGVAADLRTGLAAHEYKAEPLAAISHPAGTPHYMAPEMARVDVAAIGPATDIYLLGATLYEILTMRPPHQGREALDILIEAAKNSVLEREEPNVNRELMRIAKRAMATRPEDRFRTAEELAQAVREFRKHAESLAITENAESSLKVARNSRGARAYQYFSEALGGFSQALQLWPANEAAVSGRFAAISQHTVLALNSGDLALAESLLNQWRSYARHLPPEQKKREDHDIVDLSFQLNENRRQLKARKNTLAAARFAAGTLLAIVIFGGGIGFLVLESSKNDALQLERRAEDARQAAEGAQSRAETEQVATSQHEVDIKYKADQAEARAKQAEQTVELLQQQQQEIAEQGAKTTAALAAAFATQADTRMQEKNFSAARLFYARSLQLADNPSARRGLVAVGRPRVLWTYAQSHPDGAAAAPFAALRMAPDGRRLYAALQHGDSEVVCLDSATGAIVWSAAYLAGSTVQCRGMVLSGDGATLAVRFDDPAGGPGTLSILAADSGKVERNIPLANRIYFMALSSDGRRLAAAEDAGVALLSLADGKIAWTARVGGNHPAPLCFGPADRQIYVAQSGAEMAVLDADGQPVAGAFGYGGLARDPQAVLLSHDGSRLVLAGRAGGVGIFQVDPFAPVRFDTLHDAPVSALAVSADGRLGASASQGGDVAVWRQVDEAVVERFHFSDQPVTGLAFSADGRHLAIAGQDGLVRMALLACDQPRRVLATDAAEPTHGALAVSPDGATAFVADSLADPADPALQAIAIATGAVRWQVSGEKLGLANGVQITALAISSDGRSLAVGGAAGGVRLVNAASGEMTTHQSLATAKTRVVKDLAFAPGDAQVLALLGPSDDSLARDFVLWDWKQGTAQRMAPRNFDGQVQRVRWLPTQKRWFAGVFGTSFTVTRDLTDVQPLQFWGNPAVCVSRDGRLVAGMYQDKGVSLLNGPLLQPDELFPDSAHAVDPALDFSSDGKFLAAGLQDGRLLIWSTQDGRLAARLDAGPRGLRLLQWVPGRLALLTVGAGSAPLNLYDLSALAVGGNACMRQAELDLRRRMDGFQIKDLTPTELEVVAEVQPAPAASPPDPNDGP